MRTYSQMVQEGAIRVQRQLADWQLWGPDSISLGVFPSITRRVASKLLEEDGAQPSPEMLQQLVEGIEETIQEQIEDERIAEAERRAQFGCTLSR